MTDIAPADVSPPRLIAAPLAPGRFTPPASRAWLIGTLAILVVLRLALHVFTPPVDDEAYYWLWGQHPALAYYDHPGANAWLLGLSSFFGWSQTTLRLGPLLTTLATVPIFAWWARRLAGPDWLDYLLTAAVIWLASPIMFVFGALAFNDYLLIFLGLLAAHTFLLFFLGYEARRPRFTLLYCAAAILGLAALAKYAAVFVAIAVALVILARPGLRRLLLSPHLYLAALVFLAVQTPTVVWNVANGFPGFHYHFSRLEGSFGAGSLPSAAKFLLGAAAVLSPALIPPLIGLFRNPVHDPAADIWRTIAIALFAVSTAFFLYESLRIDVFNYWNLLAYVPLFPLAPFYLRRPFFLPHTVYGLAFAATYAVNYLVLPVAPLGSEGDIESAAVFGWHQIAARTTAEQKHLHADFVAGTYYQIAAKLGFALHRTDVTCVGALTCHEFDLWRDPRHAGGSAILLDLDAPLPPGTAESFDTLRLIETIPVIRFGRLVITYRLYYGTGYRQDARP